MGRKKHKFAFKLVLFLLVLVISACGLIWLKLQPVNKNDTQRHIFSIERGTSTKFILDNLKNEGFIHSTELAYIYVRQTKLGIKAGTYRLSKSMTMQEILKELTKGTQELVKITIPEGMTLSKTAELLDNAKIISKDDFLRLTRSPEILGYYNIQSATCEGFLFPDTYFFGKEESAENVVKTILDNFFEKTSEIPNFPKNPLDIFKAVTLASIVEREYRIVEEAPKIAGVFHNRLKINMGLQSCATVEYIITEIFKKPHPNRLFNIDLEIDNPYNTYMYSGLPPAPISNPGLVSLQATVNPQTHDYLYFRLINVETGKHAFSKTLSEHNNAGGDLILKKSAGN
ncbi:MAG: aminodeoxychorismate lyase [Treponema sp.]|nr:MAG: aminodeoxychorismate lyase [Treponema sp.]